MADQRAFYTFCLSALFAAGCVPDSGGGDDDPDAAVVMRDRGSSPPSDITMVDAGPDAAGDPDCVRTGDEVCNDADDDCDGEIDEGFALGGACTVGRGACEATGTWVCGEDGGTACSATAGEPGDERCNAVDDDCDGTVDEGYDLGAVCMVREAECTSRGVMVCAEDGGSTVCGAAPIVVQDELCNQRDDDCDGTADEGIVLGESCETGVGLCRRGGFTACGEDGSVICNARVGMPLVEECNGFDDDCDGTPDEDFGGEPCQAGVGACLRQGFRVCTGDGDLACNVEPGPPSGEVCNGIDDDCDGTVDEGYVEQLGQPCSVGVGACARESVWACDPEGGGGIAFEGIRQNVPIAELREGGFEECWSGGFGGSEPLDGILAACGEGILMLGCMPANADVLTLAAMGERDEVLTDVGAGQDAVHNHNGVDWYYNGQSSWGFAPEGTGVSRNSCDTDDVQGELRMCWHTGGNQIQNGYRCGNQFPRGEDFRRVIYHRPAGPGLVCDAVAAEPAAADECNGQDDDCDGSTDEDTPGLGEPCEGPELGLCQAARIGCTPAGEIECVAVPVPPEREFCNQVDDDCDGRVDEDFPDIGQACTVGQGICAAEGVVQCSGDGGGGGLEFEGIRQNVAEAELLDGGFERCFLGTFNGNERIADVLERCNEGVLLMGCRPAGSPTLSLAAMGERAEVLTDTGGNGAGNRVNNHNGVDWYFNDSWSWGFAPEGTGVNLNSCDTANVQAEQRMCWHTGGGNLNNGYRCGNTFDARYERVIYHRPDGPGAVCSVEPGEPLEAELCNGLDDDCDGNEDEDVPGVDADCYEGIGACQRGVGACGPDGFVCNAVPIEVPSDEICNGFDDDCDGEIDNLPGRGDPCEVGVGACARPAVLDCPPDGGIQLVEGIQNDVPLENVERMGFRQCFRGIYSGNEPIGPILEECQGEVMMIGCREIGQPNLRVAAMGLRDDVLFDTGREPAGTHEANGVAWYYSDQHSWGFAPPGAPVNRNSCDVEGPQDETRMCWHTGGGSLNFGWRCGSNTGAGNNTERFVFVADRLGGDLECVGEPGEPAAVDDCNGEDDDCDGLVDEDTPNLGEPCDGVEPAPCLGGRTACTPEGEIACLPTALPPQVEFCNDYDDDCDGAIDEDYVGLGEACVVGEGICAAEGVLICDPEGGGGGLQFAGIRQNVPNDEVEAGGFVQCFSGTYGRNEPRVAAALEACNEGVLLLGCRPVGAATLTLAAMGERAEVLTDVGNGQNAVHNHNGVDWYFNDNSSWGFAAEGTGVSRNSCDTANVQPEQRMCWHTSGGSFNSGYRCGNTFLNGNDGWERVIYHRPDGPGAICTAEAGEPLAAEECNGADDDCDGLVDEGMDGVGEDCFDGIGACQRGVGACAPDVGLICLPVPIEEPTEEICNGFDDDCSGEIDDLPGRGDACEVGVGACARPGVLDCPAEGGVQLLEGIQNDVAIPDIERMGFRQCFRGVFSGNEPIGPILDACEGEVMMIGCRELGQENLRVAAMGLREDVVFDTGQDPRAVHEANGVAWYYNDQWSWGFAPAGAPVNRNSCDVEGPQDETRMCWHTGGGNLNFGYRCGGNNGAGANTERFVYVADRLGGALECAGEPGAPGEEICNGDDDDCDGETDEGLVCPEP